MSRCVQTSDAPGDRPAPGRAAGWARLWRWALAAVILVGALVCDPAKSHAVDDPDLRYYTLETPHFYVHYYTGLEAFAHRVAEIHEEAYAIMTPLLDWTPAGKTHVVVTDKSDTANGAAKVYGRNRVTVYAMPPEPEGVLGYYDDWLRVLIYHEYVHILQLDTASEEAPLINWLIGKQLNPNQVLPRWYTEGLATLYESRRTGMGRLNSSLFQMWIRTAALEDQFFNLGTATGSPVEWPQGSAAYLYGGFFLDYVTNTYGNGFIRKFNHEYGSRLIPFSLNEVAQQVGEATFHQMWREFAAYRQAKAAATRVSVEASGRTPLEYVTDTGGANRYPRRRPHHNQMSFHRADLQSEGAFSATRTSGTSRRELFDVSGATGDHDWMPDGDTIVYGRRVVIDNVYGYTDLFAQNIDSTTPRRLTDGERAREPAVSPDGRRVAYVRNVHGSMELAVRDLGASVADGADVLVGASRWPADDNRHWQQLSMPAWRPDGRAIVFSWWRLDRRQRDLWMYELDRPRGQRLTNLTDDAAQDLDPYFGADGNLYFSSDRTGIFNAYVMQVAARKTWQLSNVVNGVFGPRPSPDGKWIYVSSYTADGYEIARFHRPGRLWRRAPKSYAAPVHRRYPAVATDHWTTRPYQPWRWLAPLTFTPDISVLLDGAGLGGSLNGQDPVGHHNWTLSGVWTTGANPEDRSAALSAAYDYSGWPIDVGLDASARSFPETRRLIAESRYIPLTERSYVGELSASYPIRQHDDSLLASTAVQLQYNEFVNQPDLEPAPGDIEPQIPQNGFFSALRFGLNYADLERYPQGVSTTDGVRGRMSLNLQSDLSDPDVNSVSLTYGFGAYASVPFFDHHVVALELNGGIIRSNFAGSRGFAIGGYSPQDVLTDLVLQQPRDQFVLRGYPVGFTTGTQYQVWRGEYRFPLYTLDKGFSTVPVFFRRIKGEVFSDTGAAYDGFLADADLLTSLGAEVQIDAQFGYFLGGSLRLGYARGLADGGLDQFYLRYGGGF